MRRLLPRAAHRFSRVETAGGWGGGAGRIGGEAAGGREGGKGRRPRGLGRGRLTSGCAQHCHGDRTPDTARRLPLARPPLPSPTPGPSPSPRSQPLRSARRALRLRPPGLPRPLSLSPPAPEPRVEGQGKSFWEGNAFGRAGNWTVVTCRRRDKEGTEREGARKMEGNRLHW